MIAVIVMILGLVLRVGWVAVYPSLSGDYAVLALMSKHIMEGREFPIYMWENHYAGTFAEYLAAGLFKLFGVSAFNYLVVGALFSFLWVLVSVKIARKVFGRPAGPFAAFLAAFPSYLVLSQSVLNGVYAEYFLFGSLMLFLFISWQEDGGFLTAGLSLKQTAFLGFLAGFTLWLTPAIAPLLLAMAVIFVVRRGKVFSRASAVFIFSFILGFLPAIIYNFQHPLATFLRMSARVLSLDRGVLSQPDPLKIVASKILWRISDIPVAGVRFFSLFYLNVGLPCFLLFLGSCLYYGRGLWQRLKSAKLLPADVLVIFSLAYFVFYAVFIYTYEKRMGVFLYLVVPVLGAGFLAKLRKKYPVATVLFLSAILLYNIYSLGHFCALEKKPYNSRRLAGWLQNKGAYFGYAGYDEAYSVVFESGEKVLISPTLFDRTFCDRTPAITKKIMAADSQFYLIETGMRDAIRRIDSALQREGVSCRKDYFENFTLYYGFSRRIFPWELNTGLTRSDYENRGQG